MEGPSLAIVYFTAAAFELAPANTVTLCLAI